MSFVYKPLLRRDRLPRTPPCKIFSAENRPLLASPPRRPCGNGSLARGPHCSSRCVFAPARSAGPPGAILAPGPPPRGGTGCNGLSWDLVFRALPGATGGGLGATSTQWDGGNRQAPTGKPPRHRTDSPLQRLFSIGTSCCCCYYSTQHPVRLLPQTRNTTQIC
jgi:hypothetical protein